jgi:hypothetical protein
MATAVTAKTSFQLARMVVEIPRLDRFLVKRSAERWRFQSP